MRDAPIGLAFITPGSPWKCGFVERVNGERRDELVNRQWLRARARPRRSSYAGGISTTGAGPMARIAIRLP
ncbi:integrase core domain-containing protein [Burkholderia territorii]|uniref:integrase core domain-containing protein n=1 Tax=Burkholderia territorii TaxID=1503055 RepID=UPI0039BF3F88